MSEGQSQCSVASSMQHRQEDEVAAAEERERAAAETAATAASLAMAKLAAARAEVEAAAAAAADIARAAASELEALRASSIGSSVSADDDRDNELKLMREASREQAAQWAAAHSQGAMVAALRAGACAAAVSPMAATTQTGADAPATELTEITTFTGGATLPPRTGTMGSRPLSGTSVPTAGGLPSPRPTTSSGPR
jgi:hypothetical protein